MSDFAARIVARALGKGPVLQPRAAPRFAPQPDGFEMGVEPAAWPDTERESAPPQAAQRTIAAEAVAPPPQAAHQESSAPDLHLQEADAKPPVQPPREPAKDPDAAPLPAAPEAKAARPLRSTARLASEDNPQPAMATKAAAASPIEIRPLPKTEGPPPLPPHREDRPPELARPKTPAAADVARHAPVPSHPPGRRVPSAPEREAAPAPQVVIEIGAVEFRAPAPPVSAPLPIRRTASLTLHDYLARRAGPR